MNYLLDTHTFIWWTHESARLSRSAFSICRDPANTLFLSLASVWEIQIKHQLGKLQLKRPLAEVLDEQRRTNQITILPVTLTHVYGLADLPAHHRDPFDRMLISQAMIENLALLSGDSQIARYPVQVVW